MHSANSTTNLLKKTGLFIFAIFTYSFVSAQENSPYSRYGIGDIVPMQNMVSRSMGGISAGFIDSSGFLNNSQSINIANPASLGKLGTTLFDLGGEVAIRTLKSNTTPAKYTATNTNISYLQLAFPITPKRWLAKGYSWGAGFGLQPMSRINYKILQDKRITGVDSVTTLYEGNGGLNRVNISSGISIKSFSFGFNTGYAFGTRNNSTKIGFANDSVKYFQSNTEGSSRFSGAFLDLGMQYSFRMESKHPDNSGRKKYNILRIGASVNLQENLKAKRDNINETFSYNTDGEVTAIDTVTLSKDEKGTVTIPMSYSFGFTYTTDHWILGADADFTSWSKYRYYGAPDAVQNNTIIHIGAQYYPASITTPASKYWSFVKYRGGVYYGNDYIKLNTANRPDYGITLGAGLPLTSFQRLRFSRDFVVLNTGVEIGQHGNRQNVSIRENILRFNVGIAMSAAWFIKRKYN